MSETLTIVVIGAGAAGFFGAITALDTNPHCRVILLEKAKQVLAKVRISGGGRCNVTHSCFDPAALIRNYPRGAKELMGPFFRFQPRDTVQWFESRGVLLKREGDGRMFPVTDSSETIIQCLKEQARRLGVELLTEKGVAFCKRLEKGFDLTLSNGESITCDKILVASGSSSKTHPWLQALGHTIVPHVPSLFTFNIPNSPLTELSGTSLDKVHVSIDNTKLEQTGPLLITHWGFSGPAILKLSAFAARILHELQYKAVLRINWLPDLSLAMLKSTLTNLRSKSAAKQLGSESPFPLSKKLWKAFLDALNISHELKWAALSNQHINTLADKLHGDGYSIDGKSTNKDEFVTCGGIHLKEVNFKTMESRLCPGLFFAGEVLDIDGVTGGFNFQNAWTTSWIAGKAISAPY